MIAATPTLILDGIWGGYGWFGPLRQRLQQQVGPTELYRYRNTGQVPFEELGSELAAHIRQLASPINIIGFSMGGLVVRAAYEADPTLALERAVFVNTPHHGSFLAYGMWRPAILQMRPGSDFLRRLAQQPWNIPTLAIWCPGDLSVFPGNLARWNKATQTARCWVPWHTWPYFSRGLHARIARFLTATAKLTTENTEKTEDGGLRMEDRAESSSPSSPSASVPSVTSVVQSPSPARQP